MGGQRIARRAETGKCWENRLAVEGKRKTKLDSLPTAPRHRNHKRENRGVGSRSRNAAWERTPKTRLRTHTMKR